VPANAIRRIALLTDFGAGIYPGQVKGRLSELIPALPVIDLAHDLAPFRPDLAAYLLPALVRDMPRGTLYLCVVDPGVGGDRAGLAVETGGDWFVGPDNGLLSRVLAQAPRPWVRRIDWRPVMASATFHGRDWFAEVAARLALGDLGGLAEIAKGETVGHDWAEDLPAVVYADGYGNLMCGVRGAHIPRTARLVAGGRTLSWARTFSALPPGEAFWYENALGLVELAVNQGRADRALGLTPGDPVLVSLAASE
jgi:S-adenosylmethionine hydrolase